MSNGCVGTRTVVLQSSALFNLSKTGQPDRLTMLLWLRTIQDHGLVDRSTLGAGIRRYKAGHQERKHANDSRRCNPLRSLRDSREEHLMTRTVKGVGSVGFEAGS